MRAGLRLRIGGADLRIAPSMAATAAFFGVAAYVAGPPLFSGDIVWSLLAGSLFVALVLAHELGHVVAHAALGDTVRSIELHGLGGVTTSTGTSDPARDMVTSAAGILVNAILAAAGAVVMFVTDASVRDAALLFVLMNGAQLVENLAPVPGNDMAHFLTSRAEARGDTAHRSVPRSARVIGVVVWGVALALAWANVAATQSRVLYSLLFAGFALWGWSMWKDESPRPAEADGLHEAG